MTRPRDTANLCSLFGQLKTTKIREKALERAVERSLPIDCRSSPKEIILAGEDLGLIRRSGDYVYLEPSGKSIAKCQRNTVGELSWRTKKELLTLVHLNSTIALDKHSRFLAGLRADPIRETLVYPRDYGDHPEVEHSLFTFSELGLIDVSPELAIVRADFLSGVNELLAALRDADDALKPVAKEPDLQAIGHVAELRALDDERGRLVELGCEDLASMVYRISPIDSSAGYDIVSFDGTDSEPARPRYIEVKGTTGSKPRFIWTRNERRIAERLSGHYWIYLYTAVDVTDHSCRGPTRIQDPCSSLEGLGFSMEPVDVIVHRRFG